jgi:putative colanic acid biosynthesis UDP-glucose lipid carrier transferase
MHKDFKASEENAGKKKPHAPAPRAHARPSAFAKPDLVSESGAVAYVGSKHWTKRLGEEPIGGWSKRAFDVCIAAVALVALSPLLLLIALVVRLDSPGKAIFKQERGGYGGRTFRIWKFRTMRVTENRGIVQARKGDARVTRVGAFLRRSSWDELPQLVNVLIGDMSIVGPRPHALEHDSKFEKIDTRYPLRFGARPGVTGLAQVNGCRGPTETEDKVRARTAFDVEYVRVWSWVREFRILAATVAVLFWKDDPGAV